MKKILIFLFLSIFLFSCSSETETPKHSFSFKMSTNLKDHTYISFKATVFAKTKKEIKFLKRRVKKTKQALKMKFKVLLAKQIPNKKKLEKLIKIIIESRSKKVVDVVVTDYVLK
ncbi:MAG: hypothetical protein GY714_28600 [Desulfobacterales bacterium]|nr:hypothetical protein [Desulfobacterales bacterium]MCP4163186.1 hypothetical protein [Deltaproteobacteria bacterium]